MGNEYRSRLKGEQLRIFNRMVNGENVFLTGNAGTGKSFLVSAFDEYCEENGIKLLKVAPTGIAACHIKGVTIHRLFKIGIDTKSLLSEAKELPTEVASVLNLCSGLLIEEVSMCSLILFDRVMQYIELANKQRREQKRKPIQLILVGDFCQLAPVVTKDDKERFDLYYGKNVGSAYAFQSRYWQTLNIQFEKLTEVRRQEGDKEFCTALDKCKEGDTSCLPFFATGTAKKEIKNAVWVVGKNATALEKNLERLNKIEGKSTVFKTQYEGDATEKDKLCDGDFECKVGARVIMLINEPSGLYQNGSMGTIKKIESDRIIVAIDRRSENGKKKKALEVPVERYDFAKYEYKETEIVEIQKNERGEEFEVKHTELILTTTGTAKQFPMKLGFAITVHKAQGQTYDEMNFMPEIFQEGQLYVALSRCRFADKLYIAEPLNPKMVRASQEVIKYYNNPENYSFFGKENDVISVQTSRKCESAVKLLTAVYDEHKTEIIDFLKALEKRDKDKKTESKETKPAPKSTGWGNPKPVTPKATAWTGSWKKATNGTSALEVNEDDVPF